jgi:uncharacterized protein (TIGR02466 family)
MVENKETTTREKISAIPLFPIPIVKTNIGRDFTETELQLCTTDIPMMKNQEMPNHQSKDRYLFDSHGTDTLKDIINFCEHQLKNYLEHIEGVDTNLAGLRITQSWLNETKPGESHYSHFHRNSYLSGVLYFKCLPDDSINFENRLEGNYNNMRFSNLKYTGWNANIVKVDIEEGDLIIFPSWIPHSVDQNETKNMERISLAFNTFPVGELGTNNNVDHLML